MGKPVCKITSADGSVVIDPLSGAGPCVDLSVPPPPAAAAPAHMSMVVSRAAGTGSGDQDIPCVDECTGNPFIPRWIYLQARQDLADVELEFWSVGSGKLTDGTAPVFQIWVRGQAVGVPLSKDGGIGLVYDGVNGYRMALGVAPAATTLRLSWTRLGAGKDTHGLLRIEGCPP